MILPDQPKLGEMAKYIKDFTPDNLVHFIRSFRKRRSGTIYIGIAPKVSDESFKNSLKFNLERRGWFFSFKGDGFMAEISKGKCRYNLVFYSTKMFQLIKEKKSIELVSI